MIDFYLFDMVLRPRLLKKTTSRRAFEVTAINDEMISAIVMNQC